MFTYLPNIHIYAYILTKYTHVYILYQVYTCIYILNQQNTLCLYTLASIHTLTSLTQHTHVCIYILYQVYNMLTYFNENTHMFTYF